MEYTQQEIYRYLEDKGHQFFIWDGKPAADDSFVEHTVDYMSLYICRKGQISFDLHGKNMKADCNCVQFFMKDHTTKITSVSDDYNSIGIIFSKSYWTESLHLDRSKFSRKIKANFGFSALHCIDGYIFTRICSELKNTDKSVKEIALDYNYHDTSHLCKFFRKMSGMSPDSYRQKARQQMTPRMAL